MNQINLVGIAKAGDRRIVLPIYEQNGVRCPEAVLTGPEVTEYADLVSIREDLDYVITLCEHRIVLAKELVADATLITAMRATWEAAVVAYGRAFVSGVAAGGTRGARTRVPRDILDRLSPAQFEVHKRTMDLRNKSVGHRVDNWTQVIVTAVLAPETEGERKVLQVGRKMFMVAGGGESAADLRDVAVILRDGLNERIGALEAEIERQLHQWPIDELYAEARADAERTAQLGVVVDIPDVDADGPTRQ